MTIASKIVVVVVVVYNKSKSELARKGEFKKSVSGVSRGGGVGLSIVVVSS